MGVVFEARDERLGRRVAIKVLNRERFTNPVALDRFRREARLASSISHPHVATVYDAGEERKTPFIVMEFVPGTDLKTLLTRGPLGVDTVVKIGRQVCSGLEAAHRLGIVHRDIKSSNIMVTPDGEVKILDFGLATIRELSSFDIDRQETGDVRGEDQLITPVFVGHARVGTPTYMSPEQAEGRTVDPRSDLFSLGISLYEALSGELPFQGSDNSEVLDAIRSERHTPLHVVSPDVPELLSQTISICLAKDPQARYSSAAALREALDKVATQSHADTVETPTRGRRRRVVLASLAAAISLTVAWIYLAPGERPSTDVAPDQPLRLAVLVPQDATSRSVPGWPELIQSLFASELTGVEGLGVVDPFGLGETLADHENRSTPSSLYPKLREHGISLSIESTLFESNGSVQLRTNVVDLAREEVRFSRVAAIGSEQNLPSAVAGLSEEIVSFLQIEVLNLSDDENLRPWISFRKHDVDAIKAFLQASRYVHRAESGAEPYLRRAIELDPDFIAPRIWITPTLVFEGKLEEARENYRHLVQLRHTASPFEQEMISYVDAYLAGDLVRRARHLEVALSYSPGNNILATNLAGTRYAQGNVGGAVEAMEPLIRSEWHFPPMYFLWGQANLRLRRLTDAHDGLLIGLSKPQVSSGVYGLLEALAIESGNEDLASQYRQSFETRLASTERDSRKRGVSSGLADSFKNLGEYVVESRDYETSLRLFERAIELAPDDAEGYRLAAEASFSKRDFATSSQHLHRLLRINPSSGHAYRRLGEIAEETGEPEVALSHYEKCLSLDPQPEDAEFVKARMIQMK